MLLPVALLLTVLTGFSALVYEIAWQKYLATLLGSHSEATAAVLGLFLGGLAAGYVLFGRFSRRHLARARAASRPPRLLIAYGILEASIGVYALGFPLFFKFAQGLSFALPHAGWGLGFALDVGLCALLIGPPAVLMGGTIPILTQALPRDLEDATGVHALVYGFNTAGAFAGALAAGYWIVPGLGLVRTLLAMGCINLLAGASFVLLGVHSARSRGPGLSVPVSAAARAAPGLVRFAAVALLSGSAMMTVQTVLIRIGALSFGASQFTFSMVVAVFVLSIALGSFAVSALPRIPVWALAANLWLLLVLLTLLYAHLDDAPYWAHALRVRFPSDPGYFYVYHLAAFGAVLGVIALPVALSGATLPLLFHALRREVEDLGSVAGRLYGLNTLGSLLGALLGGYALLFWLDLHQVYRLALVAVGAGAVLVSVRSLVLCAAGCVLVCSFQVALPSWAPERLASGPFRERKASAATFLGPDAFFAARTAARILFYDDDPTGSISVKQYDRPGRLMDRSIIVNGKPDGAALREYVTMGLASLVPALLAEKAERSFVIGYGTGVTAGELVSLDSMREVVVAEVSPAVIRAAPLFDFANRQTSRSPKLHMIRGDAFRTLIRAPEKFDVIISMPSNPWVEGTEMLYSREFLETARAHLAPGGVHAQWFHVYETDTATIELVFRTYAEVFDQVAAWYGQGQDLILLGFEKAASATDLERLLARARSSDFAAALRRVRIGSLPALLAHELLPAGVIQAARLEGPVHTLLHPRLGYSAARAFYVGSQGRLPLTAGPEPARVARRHSLVQRLAENRGGRLHDADFASLTEETCYHRFEECLALLACWEHDHPGSESRMKLEARVRRAARGGGRPLPEPEALLRLYAEDGASTAPDPVAAAIEATENFTRYYHHAVPFDRGILARRWRRCLQQEPVRCRQAMAAESATLGALGVASAALGEE